MTKPIDNSGVAQTIFAADILPGPTARRNPSRGGSCQYVVRLSDIATMGVEASSINCTGGVYGPNCNGHVALTDRDCFFRPTVED